MWIEKYSGWIGNVFLLLGALAIGEKSRYSFLAVFIGEAIWSIRVFRDKQANGKPRYDMLFICVTFAAIALRNFYLWS